MNGEKMSAQRSPGEWEMVFETIGTWPIALELADGTVSYTVWYRLPNDDERLLTEGTLVVLFTDLRRMIHYPLSVQGKSDVYAKKALDDLGRAFSREVPPELAITRFLVFEVVQWIESNSIDTKEKAEESLNVLNLLSDWHASLGDAATANWAAPLDEAANLLAGVVVFRDLKLSDILGSLKSLDLANVLREELDMLMNHSCYR